MRTLIITLPPYGGGVPAKAEWLCKALRARGHDLTVAYYATFGHDADLNAPSWTLWSGRRPGLRTGRCFDGLRSVAVGCWLPELEFSYYRPSLRWSELITSHDRHIAVGGNPLISYPLAVRGIPHLVWCASNSDGDRAARVRAAPCARRTFDRLFVAPRLRAMEKRILSGPGSIYGVSRYTKRALLPRAAASVENDPSTTHPIGYLPIPVDSVSLTPPQTPPRAGVIGFAGRLNDPRKNFLGLVAAIAVARSRGFDFRLIAAGAPPTDSLRAAVHAKGLTDRVEFVGDVDRARLGAVYRQFDVFAISSHEEGFCIAGIEAMSCGVPVVSTRCGGPEDYVRPGETGALVGSSPDEMAAGLAAVVGDRRLRARLSEGARAVAEREYSPAMFQAKLEGAWQSVWSDGP